MFSYLFRIRSLARAQAICICSGLRVVLSARYESERTILGMN